MSRPVVGGLAATFAIAIAVPVTVLLSSTHARSNATAGACPNPAAASRAQRAFSRARARYRTEERGTVIHDDLRSIASDRILVSALTRDHLSSALAEANRQLVRHVVRIRVLRGTRLLVDANPSSFDVAGSGMELRARGGRSLGRLQITVQDVIGYIKLVHKLYGAEVVVRNGQGRVRSSSPEAARRLLPASGCTQIGSRRYVVRSLQEVDFTGEPLTIRLLTPA
jgi:hypothetical protein